jgi:hypothetical protein
VAGILSKIQSNYPAQLGCPWSSSQLVDISAKTAAAEITSAQQLL